MAARAIGLDVGTNAVRAVEIELDTQPVIRRMGQVALPPGAVVDGEVADIGAVSMAVRRLWSEVGFKKRGVRVGMGSARVIVRPIEMPRLARAELLSTVRLQLDEYIPLPGEDTVFDVRMMEEPARDHTMRLLLAATHRDAVEPLVAAVRQAGLDVVAVDVIPSALAWSLTRPVDKQPASQQEPGAEVILSLGAGTVVVIAARGGDPLFSRTLASAGGRLTTTRIAGELMVDERDAERYKRLGRTEDPASAVAVRAAHAAVEEVVDEVRASLAFYAEQPLALPVRRVLLTGGGSQLTGLAEALEDALGVPVQMADPFAGLRLGRTGFEPGELPLLVPYMGAAIGIALGAARPKDRRIDLRPAVRRATTARASKRVALVAGAAVLISAAGVVYMHDRGELSRGRDDVRAAATQLANLQQQIEARRGSAPQQAGAGVPSESVMDSTAASDVDWRAVHEAIEGSSAPLDITLLSFQGVVDAPATPDPVSTEVPAAADARLGTVTVTASAPSVAAVADWLDAIGADPRFAGPWPGGLSTVAQADGRTRIQLSLEVGITDRDLVSAAAERTTPEVQG